MKLSATEILVPVVGGIVEIYESDAFKNVSESFVNCTEMLNDY